MTLCGLWHGASWNYVAVGLYNGVLLALHRIWDRALTGRPRADARPRTRPYQALAWAVTMLQVLAGLVLVRLGKLGRLLAGAGVAVRLRHGHGAYQHAGRGAAAVRLVALGHWLGGWRGVRACWTCRPRCGRGSMWRPSSLIVVLGPDVGKAFIYFQFY